MLITAAVSRPGKPTPLLERVVLGDPLADELLVRIVATGICQTDLHAHEGRLPPLPIVLGHEGAGIVEARGVAVTDFSVGDHVVLSGASCGACPNCQQCRLSYCDTVMPRSFGGSRLDGSTALRCGDKQLHSHFFGQSSFATHAVVPARTVICVSDDQPIEKLAAHACGVITGAGTVIKSLRVGIDDTIAIFGVGGVGLSAVMAAHLVGARRIVAIDIDRQRLALARELGATDILAADDADLLDKIKPISGRGVDYSFNTTTVPEVFTLAMECLAMRGTAAFASAPRGPWVPEMSAMLAGGRKLRGVLGGDVVPRQFIPMLIEHWQHGRFPFDRLLSFYPFSDIARAYDDLCHGRVIKPVLMMAGAG